ncbi:MAG TPA: tRNA dihydrouridine synthase DusB [Candidatus Ventricola intestinavium]|nr:tRNA dihydrouridine synthase DusB [Candidatus Ventricola intestinavium]
MDFDFLRRGAMLAPMAGVTDMPFRLICHEMGCPMAVSEMVSAKGYLLAPKDSRAARELLAVHPDEEGAVALQLFGHEPEILARAADELTADGRYAMLDLNMGCPVPKIVGNGEGSALMRDPVRAADIVRAVAEASHVPVTVKMRMGFEPGSEAYLLLGQLAEESGAAMITLHARTRSQFYEGHADWTAIRRLKERVSIPVVGNGDVTCWQDALRMLRETGCDGVAVGRAAQGNPWIFEQIRDAMAGRPVREITPQEKYSVLMRHAGMLAGLKGEPVAVREMRRHVASYVHGMRGAARLRTRVNTLLTLQELGDVLGAFMLEERR